jgi:glutamate carboxypeptidase
MKKRNSPHQKSSPPASDLLQLLQSQQVEMVKTIKELVELESPSDSKLAVDRLGAFMADKFERAGGRVKFHRQTDYGDHLQVDFAASHSRKPVLLLGHHDTVWPLGTLATMPCAVHDGRIWGPGSYDMKAGIVQMLFAIAALRGLKKDLPRPVTVLLNTEEEVGSKTSRPITEKLARESAAVLVLEPSQGIKGALKTGRKGVGEYRLRAIGKAAHAGVAPQAGANAILELSRQIVRLSSFIDLRRGLTLNVGVVQGGTRSNVVPAEACAEIDVRVTRMADASRIDKKLRALRPIDRKCRLELSGAINRPPMERTPGVASLIAKAKKLGESLDWKVEEASTGGASDGNFTAALGVPTLDGLGAVGEGAHALNESVIIEELPRRTALLAMLIEEIE